MSPIGLNTIQDRVTVSFGHSLPIHMLLIHAGVVLFESAEQRISRELCISPGLIHSLIPIVYKHSDGKVKQHFGKRVKQSMKMDGIQGS